MAARPRGYRTCDSHSRGGGGEFESFGLSGGWEGVGERGGGGGVI